MVGNMKRLHSLWFFGLAFGLFLVSFSPAHAQFAALGGAGVQLTTRPSYPAPHSTVVVSLDDYSVDAIGATVSWFVDGERRSDLENERSISLRTGDVGEKLSVRVVLTKTGAPSLSKEITLTPSVVDVVVETDSYVPTFYKGRRLPTHNTPMKLVAVVDDGSSMPLSAYTYKWSRAGSVLFGGPVKGRYAVTITSSLFGEEEISVEVFANDGRSVGRGEVEINLVEPEVHFYEHSPLLGLLLREVRNPFSFVSDETTLFGEPFFLNTALTAQSADFVWKLDGTEVQSKTGIPNALVLARTGGAGSAQVEYRVVTKGTVPQFIEKALNLVFE